MNSGPKVGWWWDLTPLPKLTNLQNQEILKRSVMNAFACVDLFVLSLGLGHLKVINF